MPFFHFVLRRGLKLLAATLIILMLAGVGHLPQAQAFPLTAFSLTPPPVAGYLPPGNAITNGKALLRYSLPIDNPEIRQVQQTLEGLSEWLRSKRWGPVKRDIKKVKRTLDRKGDQILAAVVPAGKTAAKAQLATLRTDLEAMEVALQDRDREAIWILRDQMLDRVGEIETAMVKGFPYEVEGTYASAPLLKGRAAIEVTTTQGPLTVVVDGYSAPVTAGNFVDLVQRGFYDGLPFIRAEDFYVLQTGDPEGPEEGFIDPKTKAYRSVPLEILVKGDTEPTYGETLEALGRYMDDPVLPFSAYGTVAMARPEEDPNGGSSQFFFFLFEPELTPAGLNLLDGRYSVFGYVTDGKDVLGQIKQGDRIQSAQVVSGLENFIAPGT
ncbi:MAG: peptidylprolyl isomerase [Cyanobacteria bacterium P01_A01_bin.105]